MRIRQVFMAAILLTTIGYLFKVPVGFYIGINIGLIIESIKYVTDKA